MLKINNKTFMNLQEAVQWLLDNNALPFQSSANYVANTEIGLGTIINPSPAKVRIGSLIFFADSKVSTVIALTENGFMVSDQYNNLVDDVVYVSNVQLNASGHLIVTLSNGSTIDAGLIKQISNFSINASQHLNANYNDGTSQDLGPIFSGNVNINGTLNALKVTGNEIVESMSGYSFITPSTSGLEIIYASVVKNGNKLTMVIFGAITPTSNINMDTATELGTFNLSNEVKPKIIWYKSGDLTYVTAEGKVPLTYNAANSIDGQYYFRVDAQGNEVVKVYNKAQLNAGTTYHFRIEQTFLLSDNLAY